MVSRLSDWPTDCRTMPSCPPLTAWSASKRLRARPARPVLLVVIGSCSGWGGALVGDGDPPNYILVTSQWSWVLPSLSICPPPPPPTSPFPSYHHNCPDTLLTNRREFLWSPCSPSLPQVRPGPGHPSSPLNAPRYPLRVTVSYPLPSTMWLLNWGLVAPEYPGKLQCVEFIVGANHVTSSKPLDLRMSNYSNNKNMDLMMYHTLTKRVLIVAKNHRCKMMILKFLL